MKRCEEIFYKYDEKEYLKEIYVDNKLNSTYKYDSEGRIQRIEEIGNAVKMYKYISDNNLVYETMKRKDLKNDRINYWHKVSLQSTGKILCSFCNDSITTYNYNEKNLLVQKNTPVEIIKYEYDHKDRLILEISYRQMPSGRILKHDEIEYKYFDNVVETYKENAMYLRTIYNKFEQITRLEFKDSTTEYEYAPNGGNKQKGITIYK